MNYTQFIENPKEHIFTISGLIIYFIFRLLQYFFTKKPEIKSKLFLSRIFYFIEIMTWFAYLSEGVNLFAQKNLFFSGLCGFILLLGIVWISWFILKDFIAGLFLKMNQDIKLNEIIEFDNISGKVIKIGSRDVELEIDGSNTINIPFNQFFIKRIIHTGTSEHCAKANFVLKLNKNLNAIEALDNIKVFIYQLPWTSSTHEQDVTIEKMDKEGTLIKICALLFDQKYMDKFEQILRERFE